MIFLFFFFLSSLHLTLFSFLSPLTITVHSVKKIEYFIWINVYNKQTDVGVL